MNIVLFYPPLSLTLSALIRVKVNLLLFVLPFYLSAVIIASLRVFSIKEGI